MPCPHGQNSTPARCSQCIGAVPRVVRVRVWHDGHWYEIAPDAQNKLTLRAVGGGQLIIKPRASNDVRLDVEGVG